MARFFADDDYREYFTLMAEWCKRRKIHIWSYFLIPNHIHFIAVPETVNRPKPVIGEVRRRYSRHINFQKQNLPRQRVLECGVPEITIQVLSVLLLILFASAAAAQEKGQNRPPIIDVHVHAYAEDNRWTDKVPNPLTGQPMTATNERTHMQATLAEMEKYNIVKAVVSFSYQAVLRWKTASPDHIITSYGFYDPSLPDLQFLRKEHGAGRIMALGEIGAQYLGLAPNDPSLDPFFALAEELDIPVSIHVGLTRPGIAYDEWPRYRAALSNPLLLEEVLIRHPKLRINVMHAGWPMLDQMIGLMWAHPQVYVDTGVIGWRLPRKEFHAYLRRIVEAGFGKRIMFGSDQMVWPETIGMAIEGIESAHFLTGEEKRDILYNNAVKFYRLDRK